jgi:ketosteroid isomerase-like protein
MTGDAPAQAPHELVTFLAEQVALLHDRDLDGLTARYAPDAVLVRMDRTARGRAEIRALFEEHLTVSPTVVEPPQVATADDVVLYSVRQRLGDAESVTVGTLVLRDGLIWRQTAAFLPL